MSRREARPRRPTPAPTRRPTPTTISRRPADRAPRVGRELCRWSPIYRQPSVTRLAGAQRPLRRSRPSTATPYQPANMGGGHSRELELAQQQVARLTKDLKKVSTELVFKESALAAAIKKAPAPQADEQLKRQLAAAEAEAANYKQMTRDAPFLREQLQRAQRPGDEKLQGAQSELLAAKRELERVTGELKFAHQEQRTLGRLQADLSTGARAQRRARSRRAAERQAGGRGERRAARRERGGGGLGAPGLRRAPPRLWAQAPLPREPADAVDGYGALGLSARLPPGARRAHRQVEDALDRRRLARRHLRRPRGSTRGRARQRQPQRRRAPHQRRP